MNITPRITPFSRIIPLQVRNLSGDSLSRTEREFIVNEVNWYLGMKNDHRLLVTGHISNGMYSLEATRSVKEGYTPQEIIEELNEERTFEGYTDKVWFVCQLSPSQRTISVKEVHREH